MNQTYTNFQTLLEPVLTSANSDELLDISKISENSPSDLIIYFSKNFTRKVLEKPEIIKNTPMESFSSFVKSKISSSDIKSTTLCWPPHFNNRDVHDQLLHLMIRILSCINDKSSFIKWISSAIYSRSWAHQSSFISNSLKAASVCSIMGERHWVLLNKDNEFTIIKINEDGRLTKENSGNLRSISTENGKSVKVVYEKDGMDETVVFIPETKHHVELWNRISNERVKFFLFLSVKDVPCPGIILKGMYEILTSDDTHFLNAILDPKIISPKNCSKQLSALNNIFAYASRTGLLYQTLIAKDMDNVIKRNIHNFEDFASADSYLFNMLDIACEDFCKFYTDNAAAKIAKYIDDSGDLYLNNVEKCDAKKVGKIYFTVIKYIIASKDLIPDEIKFVMHVARLYSAVAINNEDFTVKLLANIFFTHFFANVIEKCETKHKERVESFMKILKIAFSYGNFAKEYPHLIELDGRLEYHFYIRIASFLYSTSSISYVPYGRTVSGSSLIESLKLILQTIEENFEGVKESFKDALNFKGGKMSIFSWNFASFLISCFRFESDTECMEEKKKLIHLQHCPDEIDRNFVIPANILNAVIQSAERDVIRDDLPPAPPLSVAVLSEMSNNSLKTEELIQNTVDPMAFSQCSPDPSIDEVDDNEVDIDFVPVRKVIKRR